MSNQPNTGKAQLRADMPDSTEQEAVRTTIVGGRPPGNGQPLGPIPRGIEVLLKKAAVDAEFREILLDNPNKAAESIELTLEPVESAMMQAFPKEQLAAIIDRTEVPSTQRRAFLGTAAAAMLAMLTSSSSALAQRLRRSQEPVASLGILSREEELELELREFEQRRQEMLQSRIRQMVAKAMNVGAATINSETQITLDNEKLAELRKGIYRQCDVRMPFKTLKDLKTVQQLTDYVVESREGYDDDKTVPSRSMRR